MYDDLSSKSTPELAARLQGSLLLFTRYFFKVRNNREFAPANPEPPREDHYITMCRSLTKVFKGQSKRMYINIPPRYGKTEILCHFVAWAWARYPDCNFLYISVTHELASTATKIIRDIVSLPEYQKLFGVKIDPRFSARDFFKTNHGGEILAVGAEGTITGHAGGIKGVKRFGGCNIFDDLHKPGEIMSANNRDKSIFWFFNVFSSRLNDPQETPVVGIGQKLNSDDIFGMLAKGKDIMPWDSVVLPALDENDKVLDRDRHSYEQLKAMETANRYVFWAQYQQNPQPQGGGLYKREDFYRLPSDPDSLLTFITADTAETAKEQNDATVFSFWGLYKIANFDSTTTLLGLHILDCEEIRVEPKDLKDAFSRFYSRCMMHKTKPSKIAIEKKSTGTTLISVLKEYRGLNIIEIERSRGSGSKLDRFLNIQPYINSKRISYTGGALHVEHFIDHMAAITNNGSHSHDDICDTVADAIQLALIDESLYYHSEKEDEELKKKAKFFASRIGNSFSNTRFTQDYRNNNLH